MTNHEIILDADGLTVDEIGAPWAFLHGDIMEPGIRARLREHWGLCPRHAWGHAVVEIELWEAGAGARHGHQPFDVGVLHDALLSQMAGALTGRHRTYTRVLRREGGCYVCQQLGGGVEPVGYAGFDSTALAAEANRMTYTRRWLAETKPVWEPVACPTCAGTSTGRLCRTHLLEAGIDAASAAGTSSYLAGLDRRLRLLVDSMTQNGTPSTPDADASWVEAVAWFAGWSFPLALSFDDSNRNSR